MSVSRTTDDRAAGVIVRAPNHLGDLIMALPALGAVAGADIVVARGLMPLLPMAPGLGRAEPFDRGRAGTVREVRRLRKARYTRGILLTPSLSSALVMLGGGVPHRRGSDVHGRGPLLTDPVPHGDMAGLHRASAFWLLATGAVPPSPPVPRLTVPDDVRARWRAASGTAEAPVIGLFPGSNASSRRWDADRYASLARRLTRDGWRVLVFGGPAEMRLTAAVAGEVAVDLGGRTDLPLLAAGLASCALLVTNDSGPMHLAAAVGTPTLSMQGPADPVVTRPLGDGHTMLRHPELPCVPCVKNVCPRRGRGYVLPDATRECLRMISVDDAIAAVREHPGRVLSAH